MSTQTQRIATRHVLADSLGDPRQLLQLFQKLVGMVSEYEKDIPELRRLQRDVIPEIRLKSKLEGFWKEPQYEADRVTLKKYQTAIGRLMVAPKYNYQHLVQFGAGTLFLALLQQLELPPKLRKQVEACAKFYSRSRVQTSTEISAIAVYTKALEDFRKHSEIAEEAIKVGRPHSAETIIPAGSFRLINTGGFSSEDVVEAVKVVAKVEQLMRGIGLGKVCYGDIMISQRLAQSNVLAFYLVGKDEMFIRNDLKGKANNAVRTTCHELAHRAQVMFLKHREADIQAMYRKIKGGADDGEDDALRAARDVIKPGDVLKYRGETLVVDRLEFNRTWTVKLKLEGESVGFKMSLKDYAQEQGLYQKSPAGKFVSLYAKTDPDENFAEMVATYALGKLPQDQVEMLEAILK